MTQEKIKELIGSRYGYFTVVGIVPSFIKDGRTCVKVKCDCGKEKELALSRLVAKKVFSCGCYRSKIRIEKNTSHNKRDHPLYDLWCGIKARCNNPNNKRFRDYGGKGVKICEEWELDFESFYQWCMVNGWEKGLQIDKDIIARGKGIPALIYSPEACSIVTNKENCNSKGDNRIIEHEGMLYTLTKLAEKYGLAYDKLRYRLNSGWGVREALFTPFKIPIIGPMQPEIKYTFGFIN